MSVPTIGDNQDFFSRLRSVLPARWFQGSTPVLDGVLLGLARSWSSIYEMLINARRQTRLSTATDDFLDAISHDLLARILPRKINEPDSSYRTRIHRELVRERGTRQSVAAALLDLTARSPVIFEPARPADTGAWNGALGYGVAGGWGSLMLPYQCFITAFRATGGGIANVAGYGVSVGGYAGGTIEYASLAMVTGQVTDTDILSTIAGAMPAATIAWTRIAN